MAAKKSKRARVIDDIENGSMDYPLSAYARIAEELDVPLWVLFIPGLEKRRDLLTPGALEPLEAMVENYLENLPN